MKKEIEEVSMHEQFCFEAYKTSKLAAKVYAKALQPYKLTFPQYVVLLVLWRAGEVRVTDIQETLGISIGTLNPILNHMEKNDWIKKKKASHDKRQVMLSPLPKATMQKKELLTSVEEEFQNIGVEKELMEGLIHQMKAFNQLVDYV